ncbi:hypothetical protein QTI66_38155 [Variovorax sp. J22R133]|uniref:hypothetical protein n=1 Tax=Variovorax brevis TaxID=3053503 RepID=UPI002576B720|nr:hypothetical protein [Variovorax sp. J22R133]MDM0117915.1 hypothetical protein [Variovorax sp. J22R133]
MKIAISIVCVFSCLMPPIYGAAQTPKTYVDSRGNKIDFPLGDLSFADELVSFSIGAPAAKDPYSQSSAVLGPPNFRDDSQVPIPYTTLGCGGTIQLRFQDNALVDVKGPDLYVFEIGPAIEPTNLAISEDGLKWIDIGKVSGGTAAIDIAKYVRPGAVFHYVQLTDLKSDCGGDWPGADIDAVGAIGSALQISLDASSPLSVVTPTTASTCRR